MLKMLKNLAGQIAQNEGNVTSCKKVENNFAGARGTRLRVGAFFFRAFARARAAASRLKAHGRSRSAWARGNFRARSRARGTARACEGARPRARKSCLAACGIHRAPSA